MSQSIPEELVKEVRERASEAGGIVALARSLGINKGLVSMAYHGEYLAPVLRLAMGFPNRKPIQTCACGEVHTVPWCTKKKGAAIPETEKEIVYVEVKPEPKPKRAPRPRRYRLHYEAGRGDSGAERDAEIREEMGMIGADSFTDFVDKLRGLLAYLIIDDDDLNKWLEKKREAGMDGGKTWDERPHEGELIEVYSTVSGDWEPARYYDDGWDGIIEWVGGEDEGGDCELEEYKGMFPRWRYAGN